MGQPAGAAGQGQPTPAVRVGPLRVVFAGTPAAAVPALDAVLASRHEVVAVLTRPDAPAGRGRRPAASPVAVRATAAGVPLLQPVSLRHGDIADQLATLAPDCCPIVAYGALVPPPVLAVPPLGWVNAHFSVLPAWRGAAPVQHALLAGDDITGVTTFRLTEGLDTGPVYGVATEPVRPTDTAGSLLDRLSRLAAALLVATLDGLADGQLVAVPQPADGVSVAGKLTAADFRVDWSAPAHRVDRLIRAGTPAPGAWTTFRDRRVKLGPVTPVAESSGLRPGQLDRQGDRVLVGTGTTPVQLAELRPEGRGAMPAAAWWRGVRPAGDDRFE